MMHRIIHNLPEPRDLFARTLTQCISSNPRNPRSARWIVGLLILYLHLGPFSRRHPIWGQEEDMEPKPDRLRRSKNTP